MISTRQKLKLYRRWVWIGAKERLIDLGLIAAPVFVMTGLIAACARFWVWVFWA